MFRKIYIFIFIILFVYPIYSLNSLSFSNLQTQLPCVNSASVTSSSIPMKCTDDASIFSRSTFNMNINNNRNNRLEETFYIKTIPSGINGIFSTQNSFEGCVSTTGPMISSVGCSKLSLPLRTLSGFGTSLTQDTNSISLQQLYGVSASDLSNVIQALEITISAGWLRYTYDLSPNPIFAFPFEYSLFINETLQAYQETQAAIQNTPTGFPLSVVRCQPNFLPESDRLPGILGGCYRAPCNCSNTTNPSIPPYYTYEVHYLGPLGQIRPIVKNGKGRLTTDVSFVVNAVAILRGNIIYRSQLLNHFIPDITADNNGIKQYASIDMKLGSTEIAPDLRKYPGSLSGFGSTMNLGAILNDITLAGKSILKTQIAPDLTGGYVIDFLNDEEMINSIYRMNANNPYSITGLPNPSLVSPDKFFFISAGTIQKGVLFSSFLKGSCGFLGTSSLAALLDGTTLLQRCCDGSLIFGACLPGYNASQPTPTGFPSPKQILSNFTLWSSEFTPPGWQNYDYYLIGRKSINFQPPMNNITGGAPLLYMPIEANFDLTMDISDILLRALPTLTSYKALIPPLDVRLFPGQQNLPTYGCFFDSKTNMSDTTFYIQQICNIDSAGTTANISITLSGCQGLSFTDDTIFFTNLPAMSCTHNPFSLTTFQPLPTIPSCQKMIISSTLGSTNEVVFDNIVCVDMPGIYANALKAVNSTLEDFYHSYECAHCADDNTTCLGMCNKTFSSFPYGFTIVFGAFLAFFTILGITLCIISAYSYKKDNIDYSNLQKSKTQ